VELVWQGEFETREGALAFEQQIKGWSRAKKEALIAGDWERVQVLARSSASQGLRQAQPERTEAQPERTETQPEPVPSVRPEPFDVAQDRLVEGLTHTIVHGQGMPQRRAMAKAITLLESTRADHRAQGDALLTALLPHTGKAFRLGLSGVPGVGKSTFIEVLGLHLIAQGLRVAVLTIDPSSTVSGGSILGDKTRMEQLSMDERAFIRPSPSSGTLGGVAEKTREAMLVCEAAGHDVVIVETVGVGQSETAVAGMTDCFVLLQLPNAGDDLQAIKKGVMEIADLVVINKADIDPDAATRARATITSSLRLLGQHGRPEHAAHDSAHWHPTVLQLSALKAQGIDGFWDEIQRFRQLQTHNGELAARRQRQAKAWMWERIDAGLKQRFRDHPAVRSALQDTTTQVLAGQLPASIAARQLLALYHPTTVRAEPVEALTNDLASPSTGSGRTGV
jgi:LAO/AO transport system kinase